MEKSEAIQKVRLFVESTHPNYPTGNLVAERFAYGWTVFQYTDPQDLDSLRVGQLIFLIGDDGRITESSSSLPPGLAESMFLSD